MASAQSASSGVPVERVFHSSISRAISERPDRTVWTRPSLMSVTAGGGAEVAVADCLGGEPFPGVAVGDELGRGDAGGLQQQNPVGDPRVLIAGGRLRPGRPGGGRPW